MPTYKYKGRNMHGEAVAGTLALTSEKSAREYLRLNDMFVTDLYVSSATEEVKAPFFRRHVKLADLVVFSRQFASMVKAGVPIVQTLESLAEQTESPLLRSALQDIRRDVETGTSLSAAIGQRPRIFPEMFISLVRAGEASGGLENSLEIAAVQFDKDQELLERVKSAFTYPIIVLVATGIYLTFFFVDSTHQVVYHGPYAPLQGQKMSEAYRSVLDLSITDKAGLLIRQTHHWAANVFLAAIILQDYLDRHA